MPDLSLSKKGVKNAVETTKEAAKPHAAKTNKALEIMRKRAAALRKEQVEFAKKVAEGTIIPHAELKKKLPQLKKQAVELKRIHDEYLALMKDSSALSDFDYRKKASELTSRLRTHLKPLAPYLMEALPRTISPELTKLNKEQVKELAILNKAQRFPSVEGQPKMLDEQPMLQLLTSQSSTTLVYLPVPIEVSAPVGAEIYLEAMAGGRFDNGLPMQKLVVGKSGKVKTYWYSLGDSVGLGSVQISSPQCGNYVGIGMNVVDPIVRPLPSAVDPATVPKKLPTIPN